MKKSPQRLPAWESVSVPFQTYQYHFLSVQACWAAAIHTGAWGVLLLWLFLKAQPCRKLVGAVNFRGKWGAGVRRRELPISLESLSLQIILVAVGEGLAQGSEQGETDPVDEDKEQRWAQKGEGEERGHGDLAGHPGGTLLCLIRVGFTAGMLLWTHLCAQTQKHWGLGKEW